jgi:predicted GTPase
VTRDRRDADAQLGDLEFRLVDTAGLEEIQRFLLKDKHEYQLINNEPMNADLQRSIIEQTEAAIAECVRTPCEGARMSEHVQLCACCTATA